MVDEQVDILIVGGGLIGATLKLALAECGYTSMLVEAKSYQDEVRLDFDARTLALAPASIRILNMLNVWPLLEEYATPIDTIHVSEQGAFGTATLQRDAASSLGYVVEMQHVNRALYHMLDKKELMAPAELIELQTKTRIATLKTALGERRIQARLIVAADGANSAVRRWCGLKTEEKDYQQQAIAANIGLARAHHQHAYERFTTAGPLALLPMQGLQVSLVWSLRPEEASYLMHSSDAVFLKALQQAFGYRLGRFIKVGRRVSYPLRQVLMPEQVSDGVVFVGNAAHTLHPVAGQGFNLGLRDVAALAQCIAEQGLDSDMLSSYQQSRRTDQKAITRLTNGLIDVYTSQLPGMAIARSIGLMAFANTPLFKQLLSRYARGFAGIMPDLVCGIALKKHKCSR